MAVKGEHMWKLSFVASASTHASKRGSPGHPRILFLEFGVSQKLLRSFKESIAWLAWLGIAWAPSAPCPSLAPGYMIRGSVRKRLDVVLAGLD